ncbi:ABC transporter ATP-binding protein/permease [Cyclobacteriaceae bacterium]|nr:ABC transporter ATP-binding protein/permease [Cyclobacteriaceae bacterium]
MKSHKVSSAPLKRIFNLLSLEREDITLIYGYAILGGVIGLSLPLGIQAVMTLMVGGEASSSWFVLISLIILGVLFVGIVQILQISIMERFQQKLMVKSSFDLAFRVPRWKLEEMLKQYAPELMNRFFDVLGLQKGLSKLLVGFLSSFLQIIFAIILLAMYHPYFAMYGIALFIVTLLIFRFTFEKGLSTSMQESAYKYKVVAWLEELARTMNLVKLAGYTDMHLRKTNTIVNGWLRWRKAHFKVLMFQFGLIITFKVLMTGGLLIIGGLLVFAGELNIAQFVASEITIILIINSVEKLIGSIETIYDVLTSVEKLGKVMDIDLETDDGISFEDIDTGRGVAIEFDELTYQFPDTNTPVLDNISFRIKPGEKVCVTGMPGSGKSTLINLASTLFHNYKGNITFNDITLKNINLISIRSYVGENLAKKDLIQGTIAENISMGRDDIGYHDIKKATDAVGLTSFIQKTDEGFNTKIVPEDITVPSSVVTKIAMARSIAEKPHLFILDNFLQNLEERDKELIVSSLVGKDKFWTLIGASNDAVFAKRCDRIIVLSDGKIIGDGDFEHISSQPYADVLFQK